MQPATVFQRVDQHLAAVPNCAASSYLPAKNRLLAYVTWLPACSQSSRASCQQHLLSEGKVKRNHAAVRLSQKARRAMLGRRHAPEDFGDRQLAGRRRNLLGATKSGSSWASLPPELWSSVFRHLVPSVRDIGVAARVCRDWRDELSRCSADALWRAVWDARSLRPSSKFERLPGCWRAQVAASQLLAAQEFITVGRITLPPRRTCTAKFSATAAANSVQTASLPAESTCLAKIVELPLQLGSQQRLSDLQVALGRGTNVHVFDNGHVLVGFERGVCLLRKPLPTVLLPSYMRKPGATCPRICCQRKESSAGAERTSTTETDDSVSIIDVERSKVLGGIVMFASERRGERRDIVAATTSRLLIVIHVDSCAAFACDKRDSINDRSDTGPRTADCENCRKRVTSRLNRTFRWRIIDNFQVIDGHLVSLVNSEDRRCALAGFSNGYIRIVDVSAGCLVHVLSMRESPDVIVAAGNHVIGSSFTRTCISVWDVRDGRTVHRFDQTSVGWEEVSTVAGVCRTRHSSCFALWDGKTFIRTLDVATGRFVKIIDVRGALKQDISRTRDMDGDHGTTAAHVGPDKMLLCGDERTLVVAMSNKVVAVNIEVTSAIERVMSMVQIDNVQSAILGVSTDNRFIVTAEGDAFGYLSTRLSAPGRQSGKSRISVWDLATGQLRRQIPGVNRVSSLSIANNTIAVVSGGPNDISETEPAMTRGDAVIFTFGI